MLHDDRGGCSFDALRAVEFGRQVVFGQNPMNVQPIVTMDELHEYRGGDTSKVRLGGEHGATRAMFHNERGKEVEGMFTVHFMFTVTFEQAIYARCSWREHGARICWVRL